MLDLRLYMLQRLTALIMAPLVIGHIAVMIDAVQGGLTLNDTIIIIIYSRWCTLFGTMCPFLDRVKRIPFFVLCKKDVKFGSVKKCAIFGTTCPFWCLLKKGTLLGRV